MGIYCAPLLAFGQALVAQGVLTQDEILTRLEGQSGQDFFVHHSLGTIMGAEDVQVRALIEQVRAEPDPPTDSIEEHIYAPFPEVSEPAAPARETNITYGGAIRAAISNIIGRHGGVMWGQDVAELGGVMQASAGVLKAHPEHIIDAPLNEPLIIGTACGAGLHDDIVVMPEIQFGDYALNAFHWFVHMGNLYWTTNGNSRFAVIMRTPVDPFGGGAVYHSMSLDGYLTAIPGLVILMPSTSWDVYGLLMTAAEYRGPVICLEPKWMYRQYLGPAFPDEPTDDQSVKDLRRFVMRGGIPDIDPNHRVPFSKAAVRRAGDDVTIVAWGRAVWTAMRAAEQLAAQGTEAEVIDLRTLVPPDLDTIRDSVKRTGRLIVAAEDRAFAGYVRAIQGAVVELFPGLPTRALGQKNIPGISQNLALEEATILTEAHIVQAAEELRQVRVSGSGSSGWSWVPPRFLLG